MYCQGVCLSCYNFAGRYKIVDQCRGCRRRQRLKESYCRLCWCQARYNRDHATDATDARSRVVIAPWLAAVRGHQLFFSDMDKRTAKPRTHPRRYGTKGRPPKPPPAPVAAPTLGWVQPPLFEQLPRDYNRVRFDLRKKPAPDNPWLTWALYLAHRIAETRGWPSVARRNMQRTLVRLLSGYAPAERITYLDIRQVTKRHGTNVDHAIEILDAMGITIDDQPHTFELWLQAKLADLPQPFADTAAAWTRHLQRGGPRARPRHPGTASAYLRYLLPALRDWSSRYHHLREVTRGDVLSYLATQRGHARYGTITALRALFTWAKRTKTIFANPATRLRGGSPPWLVHHPLSEQDLTCTVEAATTPQAKLFIALAVIHAARTGHIRALQLHDVDLGNRRITIAGNQRPLDDLTYRMLRQWLQHRRTRWPNTANPHLIISFHTALGLGPVSATYLPQLPATIERLRIDRQLEEALISGGDPLHLAAVFGISDAAAVRWATNARILLGQPQPGDPSTTLPTQVSIREGAPLDHLSSA
jgi:integrase